MTMGERKKKQIPPLRYGMEMQKEGGCSFDLPFHPNLSVPQKELGPAIAAGPFYTSVSILPDRAKLICREHGFDLSSLNHFS